MKMDKKVFIIGLDGATLDLILPWVKERKLPAFARLIKEGVHGPLESTPNQRSASAWTSFMTGRNPGKHGIYEFYDYVPGTYDIRFLNGNDRRAESLWGALTRNKKRVVVINVPMTYPAEEVNGLLVAGLDSPGPKSKGFTYPQDFQKELDSKFGNYIIEPGITGFIVKGEIDEALKSLYRELDQKFNITNDLMDSYQWDFFMVVFRSLDAVQHCFWKFMDPLHPDYTEEGNKKYGNVIFDIYKRIDQFIDALLKKIDNNVTLIIMSDHGFGRKHRATSQLNQWLESKGYLFTRDSDEVLSRRWSSDIQAKVLARLYKGVVGKTPRSLKEKLVKFFPDIRNKIQTRLIFAGIDWERTMAYSDTLFPNIMINLKDREPLGTVKDNEYNELIKMLISDLKECRDSKSGDKIVDQVFERDEIYSGPHSYKAPDLLIRWREDISINGIKIENASQKSNPNFYPLIPGEDPRIISGDHRLNGILFLKGGNIRQNHEINDAGIIDIAPTVLYILDCLIPEDIDGKVLKDAFAGSYFDTNPPLFEKGGIIKDKSEASTEYSTEDSDTIASRLRDLGYIE